MKNHEQSNEIVSLKRGLIQCEMMISETDDSVTKEFLQKLCQVYLSLIKVQKRYEKFEKEHHMTRVSGELAHC